MPYNAFGGFTTTSPVSAIPHNSCHDLASNSIRDFFGPTVQTVFDYLLSKSGGCTNGIGSIFQSNSNSMMPGQHSTLVQIISKIRQECKRNVNSERVRLVKNLSPLSSGRQRVKVNMARGDEEKGFIVEASAIRAALIVLLQHSIVKAVPPSSTSSTTSTTRGSSSERISKEKQAIKHCYILEYKRALFFPRYPRYIEYARTMFKDEGAAIIEELLTHGRMTTIELISSSVDSVKRHLLSCASAKSASNDDDESDDVGITKEEEIVLYEKVVSCVKDLVKKGFLEIVLPISNDSKVVSEDHEEEQEAQFADALDDLTSSVSGKKRSIEEISGSDNKTLPKENDLEGKELDMKEENDRSEVQNHHLKEVYSMLRGSQCRQIFPPGAVWRVNIYIFHSLIRADYLGRIASERYSDKLANVGDIVTAALKCISHRQFGLKKNTSLSNEEIERLAEEKGMFTPDDIMEYLPETILAALKNKAGGARSNLSTELVTISTFTHPQVLAEVEEARGHPLGGKFEMMNRQTVTYLRNRISHHMVQDQYGEVAARICSILELQGNLETSALAEHAMVPARDAQSILHQLYTANYISFLYLQQSKQHNPASAIYLWSIDRPQLIKNLIQNICRAMCNLRLRRQHEMEIGKDWIERAKESGATDENETEMDRLNYSKFCQGLERIDNALLQLDNSLMILNDFDF